MRGILRGAYIPRRRTTEFSEIYDTCYAQFVLQPQRTWIPCNDCKRFQDISPVQNPLSILNMSARSPILGDRSYHVAQLPELPAHPPASRPQGATTKDSFKLGSSVALVVHPEGPRTQHSWALPSMDFRTKILGTNWVGQVRSRFHPSLSTAL